MTPRSPAGDATTRRNLGNYDTDWSSREYSRQSGLWPIEAELIDRHFPKPPAAVLDIGCGAGRTSAVLHERGYRIVAIDVAIPLVTLARTRWPEIDFRQMDARRLEFPDETFDAAFFSYNGVDNLYPESARMDCFREVRRVLKAGGPFLFSSHNLIGALFSGGFSYARGYLNAARLLARQVANPLALEWYIKYEDGGGPQHLFAGVPARTVRQLEAVGLEVVDVCGSSGERNPRRVLLHEQHVQFVARRAAR